MGTLLETGIHHVTVYRQGAVVTRVAELDAEWPEQVEVHGLPLAMLDASVRVEVVGADDSTRPPQPTDVRVELALPPVEPPPPPPAEEQLEALRREIRAIEARLERLGREQTTCDRLSLELADGPTEGPDLRPPPAPLQAWLGMIDWREEGRRQRLERRQQLRDELHRAHEQLDRLERQEAAAKAVRGPDPTEVAKRVVLRLRGGAGAGPLVLKLEYQVPGACWRPTYVLRVARDGQRAELGVRALVAQQSGEPWSGVRLALSTADLARDTTIPELTSLRIGRRQRPPRKAGYREPPADTGELFKGLDDALDVLGRAELPPEPIPLGGDSFADPFAAGDPFAAPAGADPFGAPSDAPFGAPADSALRAEGAALGSADEDLDLFDSGESVAFSVGAAPEPDMMRAMAPPPGSAPKPSSAPMEQYASRAMPAPKSSRARSKSKKRGGRQADMTLTGGGGGEPAPPSQPPEPRPAQLDYGMLVMRPWDTHADLRGRLRRLEVRDQLSALPGSQQALVQQLLASARGAAARLEGFPGATTDVGSASGAYDYRYTSGGLLDLPSDGKVHNVPLFAREAPVKVQLISVPRESDQVVRTAELENPLVAPLLAGPADVYLEDEFLVTSPIRTVPAGATLTVGLGVEEGLKVARNTHYDETSKGGLLGGSTKLEHRVEIEVASRLGAPVQVEVRERVPLPDDDEDDVTVTLGKVSPAWEDFEQPRARIKGGKRWRFELAPGDERALSYSYMIQLGGKQELAGGNRRD